MNKKKSEITVKSKTYFKLNGKYYTKMSRKNYHLPVMLKFYQTEPLPIEITNSIYQISKQSKTKTKNFFEGNGEQLKAGKNCRRSNPWIAGITLGRIHMNLAFPLKEFPQLIIKGNWGQIEAAVCWTAEEKPFFEDC